uniref:Small ribosomal subunit protein uS3m n=1 Tax=Arthrocladium fulminans TaxID=1758292 RepID=A0A6B9UP40_9EURO|nr:Ribosomal protein S3 [Arthrocladium fulminans]
MKIIKSFFSLYNKSLEKTIRTKRLLLRLRRLSSNRIYLSKGEFKHTNNSVLINIYIFNRQKYNYLSKLKNIYLKNFLTKKNININIIKTLKSIYIKGLDSLREVNKDKYLLIKAINIVEKNKKYKINTFKSLSNYTIYFYKNLLNLTMKKLRLYFLYKQLIYLNKSKLNYTYLRLLKKHLENLYNKNVEFNLINLNRFYLNSDILFESVKLKLTRNKRKMRKILNKIKDKIKINEKNLSLESTTQVENQLNQINDAKLLKNIIFNNLKYRHVSGFRLEARGRLSRRYTASRSVFKLKYKGNLLNLDSSYKRLSSVVLKGNLKSNIQYTKINSKTRIGSFGIKGWVSGN